MDTDAQPPNMDDDSALPPDLREQLVDAGEDPSTLQEYETLWQLLQQSDAATDASFSEEAMWDTLQSEVLDTESTLEPTSDVVADSSEPASPSREAAAPRPLRRKARATWIRRGATALAVVAVALIGMLFWWNQPVTVHTAAGEQTTVSLPDGSTAHLNGASTLSYARGFATWPGVDASQRTVDFSGEAFFAVEPEARPFQINTENAQVEVLGTAFRVRARTDADGPVTTAVTLQSGRVQLRGRADTDADPITLSETGHESRVVDQASPTSPTIQDTTHAFAWRTGGFAARSMPLPQLLQEIEYRFGTPVQLNEAITASDTLTVHYATGITAEEVLEDIALLQGLQYRELTRGYELYPAE